MRLTRLSEKEVSLKPDGKERILGAAYLHVPTGYITPPESIHGIAMFDPGLQKAAKKEKMNPDRFVARYLMDRIGDSIEDGYEFVTGFVSDRGKFYDREQATAIAKANPHQPPLNSRNGHDRLDATDLHWQNESIIAWLQESTGRKITGPAMIDHLTGKIYSNGTTHYDVQTSDEAYADFLSSVPPSNYPDDAFNDHIWDMISDGRLEDGFVDDAGTFYSRTDAARAIRFDPTKGDPAAGQNADRNWLDSFDLDRPDVPTDIHESITSYNGYSIDGAVRDKLLERFPPMFDRVAMHHITYQYGVEESLPPTATVAKIIATVSNDRAQALIVEINGTTKRPNGQTFHITVSYAASQGASAKDSNQAIAESPWEPLERPMTIPITPRWFNNRKAPTSVAEDVESDAQQAAFLINVTNAIQGKFRGLLKGPLASVTKRFIDYQGMRAVYFTGAEFNLPGAFKELYVVLRPTGTRPEAAFHAYEHEDGHVERVISFAVLPPEGEEKDDEDTVAVALHRMVSDYWGSIMHHELHHVVQDIRQIPMTGKGSYTNGTPDQRDYFNSPFEFDAYYQQIARDYHAMLLTLRQQPELGKQFLARKGFDRDFRKSLDKMLPKNMDDHGWGVWYYARQKQNQRLTKRLYALHQAIVAAMDQQGIK